MSNDLAAVEARDVASFYGSEFDAREFSDFDTRNFQNKINPNSAR